MWLLEWTILLLLSAAALAITGLAVVVGFLKHKYPRGPSWFTSLRFSLIDFEDMLKYLKVWKQQFHPVYALFNGSNPRVFMTDYDVIHDAFVRQADLCSSRPSGSGVLSPAYSDKGIIASPHWKEQRKFALTVLREQGMGNVDMEVRIMEEVGSFLKQLEKLDGRPVKIDSRMHQAISNVICNMVFGSRFEYDDPVFASLLNNVLNQNKFLRKMTIVDSTLLKFLPGDFFGYHKYVKDVSANMEYFLNAIQQHKETLNPDSPRDFIDAYLIQIKEMKQHNEQSSFDETNCVASVAELFIAGTDTTATTLLWAWLFMIIHPEVQITVQREIDQCIGLRQPALTDKVRMPYTEAVLSEVLRLANTAVASLPHKVEADMTIGGHCIPKDAVLHASLSDVHLDSSIFSRPQDFDPQRFLTSEGKFEKPRKLIPFGIGRRACPGESLARAELFLFFTSVLQHFNIETPIGCTVRAEGKVELIHKPLPYLAIFNRRSSSR